MFTRELADRTEGKPRQKHEVTTPRETIFRKDPDAKPAAVQGPGGAPEPVQDGVLVDEDGCAFVAVRQ